MYIKERKDFIQKSLSSLGVFQKKASICAIKFADRQTAYMQISLKDMADQQQSLNYI